jgi:predicted nucleotidyltransferase
MTDSGKKKDEYAQLVDKFSHGRHGSSREGDEESSPLPTQLLVDKFVQMLRANWHENLVSIILYGSVARGDYRPDSDIDLLIVCERLPQSQLERRRQMTELVSKLDNEVAALWDKGYYHHFSTLIKTREEAYNVSPIYLDLVEDAVILYDKDDFFHIILSDLGDRLQELGARRIYVGKKWYWDICPESKFGETVTL